MTEATATKIDGTENHLPSSKPKHHGLGRWSGATLALALAVAGLAAGRLGLLWPSFDVFTQLTAQFLMAFAGFALALFVPRQKTLTGIVLLIAFVLLHGMWPHYASSRPEAVAAPPPGMQALKVASFNTWRMNPTLDALEAEINRLDADVVVLTEFPPNRAALAQRLKVRYPHQHDCHALPGCHFMILSKTPLSETGVSKPLHGYYYIRARLGPERGGVTVFGVHTLRFPFSTLQFKQAAALRKAVAASPGPLVVMGDFNTTPYSRLLGDFQDQTGLNRLTSLPTWPATWHFPQIAIDHIFASPALIPLSAEHIGNNAGSDHYPVSLTLAVPAP